MRDEVCISTTNRNFPGRSGTVDDAVGVAATMLAVAAGLVVFEQLPVQTVLPRSLPVIALSMAVALSVGSRVLVRLHRERRSRPDARPAERVIILGAGPEGQHLVRAMLSEPGSRYLPVALLDDDPAARRRRVSGIAVRGTQRNIAAIASRTRARLLVIACRDLDAASIQTVTRAAVDAGLGVIVLPPLGEVLQPEGGLAALRKLDITDLLGRQPVDIDVAAVAGYLTGRRVLVTGAGGSIGSELCRQIHRFEPGELLMLDRDESALHATQLSIYNHALLDSPNVILADIRDASTIADIFLARRPDVVFHAAALKHLPMLEQYPVEAWKTNVLGTRHVLDAARESGVAQFVNISTDKAANPTSVLGRSKRIGERLVADAAAQASGCFLSVRFGNVLGSRGSVLVTFAEQLAHGGPITVTHPEVTRFFMTIPEAVQLVIYAAAIGQPGEALVLDMGEPVRIVDVARQLMGIARRPVPIAYTGLRPGEKLHEQLFGDGEPDERPIHALVSHVPVPRLEPEHAVAVARSAGAATAMRELAPPGMSPQVQVMPRRTVEQPTYQRPA